MTPRWKAIARAGLWVSMAGCVGVILGTYTGAHTLTGWHLFAAGLLGFDAASLFYGRVCDSLSRSCDTYRECVERTQGMLREATGMVRSGTVVIDASARLVHALDRMVLRGEFDADVRKEIVVARRELVLAIECEREARGE